MDSTILHFFGSFITRKVQSAQRLWKRLNALDIDRGQRISESSFIIGAGVAFCFALTNYCFDFLESRGFVILQVPTFLKAKVRKTQHWIKNEGLKVRKEMY